VGVAERVEEMGDSLMPWNGGGKEYGDRETVIAEITPGIVFEKRFNSVTIHFHSEKEAEAFYIVLCEQERKGSSLTISFDKGERG